MKVILRRKPQIELMPVSPAEVIDEVPDELVGLPAPRALVDVLRNARLVAARLAVHAVEFGGSCTLQADFFNRGDEDMVDVVAHSTNSAISSEQLGALARMSSDFKGIQGWSAGNTREGGTYIRVTIGVA